MAQSSKVTIEVTGQWAGSVGDWRPAVTGTLNQSTYTDAEASTFTDYDSAMAFFEECILPDLPEEPSCSDQPHFRLVCDGFAQAIG